MPPARASLEGPFSRSLREALESVASAPMVPRLISMSLAAAARGAVPEDAAPFAAFVEGPLLTVVVQTLGHASYEVVEERLAHVLLMATSQVRARDAYEGDADRDEDSRVRLAEPAGSDVVAIDEIDDPELVLPLPPLSSPLVASPGVHVPRPRDVEGDAPRDARRAQTLGRMVAPTRSRGAVEQDARPAASVASRAQETLRPPRQAPARVLVATLDPLLIAETEARLEGRSHVAAVGTSAELSAQLAAAGGRVALIVDTALPSIDVPSFAALAPSFPPGTLVVLWGMSERQKQRLVTMFPVAESWIASGVAASPADLLLEP